MRSTIIDIKNRTGLSLATISKYLNGGKVRPENKVKIDEAVKALNYQVNENARSLVTNRTHTIGVVVFDIENYFCGTLMRHIGDYLRRFGYGILICNSNKDEELEKANIRSMLQKNVDGVILLPVSESAEAIEVMKEAGKPVVTMDRMLKDAECDSVTINNQQAAYELTSLLLRMGHRRIGYVGSKTEYTGEERWKGFHQAMKDAGLIALPEYESTGLFSITTGYNGMKKLLDLRIPPTAVLTGNYEATLGAVIALRESPYTYPDDVSLVGFDKTVFSDVIVPRITVAEQPMREMAEAAGELLIGRIEQKTSAPFRNRELKAKIIEMDSVRSLIR